MRKIIGLTGGIATGKSTVARMFLDEGVYVIDSDILAKQAQNKPAVMAEMAHAFGAEIIENGKLNRTYLAQLIFSNPEKRAQLNALIHPIVKQEILMLLEKRKNDLVIVDVPLMYETDYYELMDEIIVVYTPRELQIERLMHRNHLTYQEAVERVDAQLPLKEKVAKADYVLDNSSTKHNLYLQFKHLYNHLIEREDADAENN